MPSVPTRPSVPATTGDQFAQMRLEAFVPAFLIGTHQARIATTSAARIAARRRVAVVMAIARVTTIPAPNLTYCEQEGANFMRPGVRNRRVFSPRGWRCPFRARQATQVEARLATMNKLGTASTLEAVRLSDTAAAFREGPSPDERRARRASDPQDLTPDVSAARLLTGKVTKKVWIASSGGPPTLCAPGGGQLRSGDARSVGRQPCTRNFASVRARPCA
jgi:hypothetical protein